MVERSTFWEGFYGDFEKEFCVSLVLVKVRLVVEGMCIVWV